MVDFCLLGEWKVEVKYFKESKEKGEKDSFFDIMKLGWDSRAEEETRRETREKRGKRRKGREFLSETLRKSKDFSLESSVSWRTKGELAFKRIQYQLIIYEGQVRSYQSVYNK